MMKSDFSAADNITLTEKSFPTSCELTLVPTSYNTPRLLRQVFQILGSLAPANKGILYYDRLKKS
jgi:hypothetical protein